MVTSAEIPEISFTIVEYAEIPENQLFHCEHHQSHKIWHVANQVRA
jgi:hypothetical protein